MQRGGGGVGLGFVGVIDCGGQRKYRTSEKKNL